ncbi:uncharacterized protein DMAD_11065 [Drosophila madeirensis]|uniref:C2H2-type domain-containing protein n=1 Tax=Drosophila madeirensis TaxID=30013 RepID=A0AAU9FBS9_DROMD
MSQAEKQFLCLKYQNRNFMATLPHCGTVLGTGRWVNNFIQFQFTLMHRELSVKDIFWFSQTSRTEHSKTLYATCVQCLSARPFLPVCVYLCVSACVSVFWVIENALQHSKLAPHTPQMNGHSDFGLHHHHHAAGGAQTHAWCGRGKQASEAVMPVKMNAISSPHRKWCQNVTNGSSLQSSLPAVRLQTENRNLLVWCWYPDEL